MLVSSLQGKGGSGRKSSDSGSQVPLLSVAPIGSQSSFLEAASAPVFYSTDMGPRVTVGGQDIAGIDLMNFAFQSPL